MAAHGAIQIGGAANISTVHLKETTVTPSLPLNPTTTEALAGFGATRAAFGLYTGTDVPTDEVFGRFFVDSSGNTLDFTNGLESFLFLAYYMVAPAGVTPTAQEIQDAIGPVRGRFCFYTGTNTPTDPVKGIWAVSKTGQILEIKKP